MARTHNELRRGPLGRALKDVLGDSDGEGQLERFGETLQPIIDLWSLPEWAFERDERLCAASVNEPAGAATELSSVALVNPADSGLLIVVELLIVRIPVFGAVALGMASEAQLDAVLLVDTAGANVDTRWANATEPRAVLKHDTTAVSLGVRIDVVGTSAQNRQVIDTAHGIVLSPGFGLVVQNGDDAAVIDTAWRWRERRAFAGELT